MNLALYIPINISHEGRLQLEGDVHIDGQFNGSLHTEGSVTISSSAQFYGSLVCLKANVFGFIQGEVKTYEQFNLHHSGKMIGKLDTPKATLAEGAQFSGLAYILSTPKDNQ
ncbi:MAG: hypothetical protein CMK59_00800 [Proteobacteria bacterium]|nr:hypothetical protein [Pseudomonadota bacterium]